MKILVADDDEALLEVMAYSLLRQGYLVLRATTGEQALRCWQLNEPSIVILDSAIPDPLGLEVCRHIRTTSTVPIVVTSDNASEREIIRALEAGADEYMVKPFSPRQLSLRIESLARRMRPELTNDFGGAISVGGLVIDPQSWSVVKKDGGQAWGIRLTRLEFRILYCLAANAGKVVVTDKLADFAWQGIGEGDPALLKSHISRVRSKLGISSNEAGFIRSIPGVGYTLTI